MAEPTPTPTTPPPAPAPTDDHAAMKAELEALRKEKAQWSTPDPTLNDKVKLENDQKSKQSKEIKDLESAVMFNLASNNFLKENESLLPKEVTDIFKIADRENYSNSIDKANAIKASVVQSFFSQQSNLELLTPTQQSTLADYLKLTKNGKEEKAREIYDNLFEPALSTLRRVKKAEELIKAKQGFGGNTDADQAYKDKLKQMADKKFFRGKHA